MKNYIQLFQNAKSHFVMDKVVSVIYSIVLITLVMIDKYCHPSNISCILAPFLILCVLGVVKAYYFTFNGFND